jgi:hypothetical protein
MPKVGIVSTTTPGPVVIIVVVVVVVVVVDDDGEMESVKTEEIKIKNKQQWKNTRIVPPLSHIQLAR